MRVRTLMTLSSGVALGATSMYLFDPEHGTLRRREARRGAGRQVREGSVRAVSDLRRRGEDMAVAAVREYRQARVERSAATHLDAT